MGDHHVCNGEYKCALSGANKRLVPDHIDRRVESGSSSATPLSITFSHYMTITISKIFKIDMYFHYYHQTVGNKFSMSKLCKPFQLTEYTSTAEESNRAGKSNSGWLPTVPSHLLI